MKNSLLFAATILLLGLLMSSCEGGAGIKINTYTPANITSHSALVGAEVEKLNKDIYFGELGVCWSTSPNPTYIEDNLNTTESNHISTSDFRQPFTGKISHLKPNKKYYVRAYLKNMSNQEIYYGKTKSFKTTSSGSDMPVEGSLKGKFSVAMGEQICFSKGNLQYHPVQGQWRFAEHQWDIIGVENNYTSDSYNGWIDLFGWRTSGFNNVHPYETATQTQFYGPLTAEMAGSNYDWGVFNAISNGGNQIGLWRTLEWAELQYLFEKRQTTSGCRFAMATVNGINGLILLPDDWNTTYYPLYNINVDQTNWEASCSFNSNIITLSDWNNHLENHGAVFLPAAGERVGSSTNYYSYGGPGAYGRYWTSTWHSGDRACCLYFYDGRIIWNNFPYVNLGLSVRLVRNVD